MNTAYANKHEIERELRLATPRRARFTRKALWGRRVAINLYCAALFGLYLLASADVRTMDTVARQGEVTTATVIDKRGKRGKSATLLLRFEGAGQTVLTFEKAKGDRFDAVREGDRRAVTYLPSNPKIHYFGEVTPERVQGRRNRWGGWVGFGALVVAAILIAVEADLRRTRRLLREGVPVPGAVVKREEIQGKTVTYRVTYAYAVGSRAHQGAVDVSKSHYEALYPGTEFTVLYDPAEPSSSIPYAQSDLAEIEGAPPRRWPPAA